MAIWITEDRTNFGRLLHVSSDGRVKVIGERLRSPQSVVLGSDDEVLVAEQGRDRILSFTRDDDESLASLARF